VILNVCAVDPVVVRAAEHTKLLVGTSLHDGEVVEQVDSPVVQPHMVVRTQAQDILRDVRPEVGPAPSGRICAPSAYGPAAT
jgi:hypothetical protein